MKRRLLLAILLMMGIAALAAPLKNIEVRLTQPDGQIVNCYASGDEFYNYLHDANGFTIVQGTDGYYVYATKDAKGNVVPSIYRVGAVDPVSAGLQPYVKISQEAYYARRQKFEQTIGASRNGKALTKGRYNNLVVFIRFAGDSYHNSRFSKVDSMFNASNYEASSLHNYYHRATYNQLDLWSYYYPAPDGETILSYEDIHPKAYYQPYNPTTNPIGYIEEERAEREFDLLERAINYIEDMVPNTIDFDNDDDGLVDNVVFVVKGEVGEWASLLWPHRWNIYDRYVPLHDLQVFDFNFQLEAGGYFTVGTLCHEMCHSLGAPDLYHYSDDLDPAGAWDLMCGTTDPPQNEGAYMKYKYGYWIDEIPTINPNDPNAYGTYELEAVSWEGNRRNAYKIPTNNPNQFFLVEYRNKANFFDKEIPGSGLLVYRIDTRFNGGAGYNGYDTFDEVYIFRPDGTPYQDGSLTSAHFNAESGRTEFHKNSNPYPFLTNGQSYNAPFKIINVGQTGDRITFDLLPFQGAGSGPAPTDFIAHVNSIDHQVELSWSPGSPNDASYRVFRDNTLIAANLTETTFIHPFTEADYGYHVYSVVALTGGTSQVLSAKAENWVILGPYETLHLAIDCDSPHGTKGGELEVSFDNPRMKTQYYTIYEGSAKETDLYVPGGTTVTFHWLHGFDPESQGIHILAEHTNDRGSGVIFDLTGPASNFTQSYTVADDGYGVIPPQHLRANLDGQQIHVTWAVQAQVNRFDVYRDGELQYQGLTENHLYDNQFTISGAHHYRVKGFTGNLSAMDPDASTFAVVLIRYCEPPRNLHGTHQDSGINELAWEAPLMDGHGMLAYDDNQFDQQIGSISQRWGIKLTPEHLQLFDSQHLTHLEMYDCSAGDYTYKIYNGETAANATLIHEQTQTMTGSGEWVRIPLDEELAIDNTLPVWIAVKSTGANYPIPCCSYSGFPNSAMLISGNTWKPASYYGVELTWMLRVYTKPTDNLAVTYNLYWGSVDSLNTELQLGMEGLTATNATHPCNEKIRYAVTAVVDGRETAFSDTLYLGMDIGVEEAPEALSVKVYPNPTSKHLTISGKDLSHVTIHTLTGLKVLEKPVQGETIDMDISSLPAGTYLLKILSEEGISIIKVIKE